MVNRIMCFELCSESTQFILLTEQCTYSFLGAWELKWSIELCVLSCAQKVLSSYSWQNNAPPCFWVLENWNGHQNYVFWAVLRKYSVYTPDRTMHLLPLVADSYFLVVTIYNVADRHQDTSISEDNIASILRTDSSIYQDMMWWSLGRQMETVHSCKTFISIYKTTRLKWQEDHNLSNTHSMP